jgi:hypothetical protein
MTLRRAPSWPALLLSAMPIGGAALAQNAPYAGGAAQPASVVQACIDRIPGSVIGLPKLEERCPDLQTALQAAGVRPLIIDSSRAVFDRDSLSSLLTLIHAASGPAPSVAALTPILGQLHGAVAPPRSWWRRLWEWVLDHFANGKRGDASTPWWRGMLRQLLSAQWLWTAIIWITIIALPIAVVIIAMREVRAMGKRSTDAPRTSGATAVSARLDSQLAQLRRAALAQRPAQLFAMLIARLVAAGRLPPDRSLTHREVVRTVLLEDAAHLQLIETLARLSERQLYAAAAPMPAGLEELLSRGEDLYIVGWNRPPEKL